MTPLLSNPWILAIASSIGGGFITVAVSRVIGKRGLFTYHVWHDRIAVATEDDAFGSVRVLWGTEQVANLFLSTVELRNESLRDFTEVAVRVWSPNSNLLTERSEVVGTTSSLHWTDEYATHLALSPGEDVTEAQLHLWNAQREYNIPTMNRGQVVRISILNSVRGPDIPALTLEILHPGVKVKCRTVPQLFLGVPQSAAALTGTISGVLVVLLVAFLVKSPPVAAVLAFVYGVAVLIPGALILRLAYRVRDWIGD
jgi:hypothetical protein